MLLKLSCFFEFISCLSSVQTDLHLIFPTLEIRICYMTNIEACFSLNILCIIKQAGIRGSSRYFLVAFFFL